MPNTSSAGPPQPLLVSILRQGSYLIASIHTALDDSQLLRFQRDLIDRVGRDRATGIIIDVAALDVVDSFATATLRVLARIASLRGAQTVIVGINPDVAFAMVQLGMDLDTVHTALDLDEGLAALNALSLSRDRTLGTGVSRRTTRSP
jgi:rsbT antagonist protein RsbS